MDVTIHSSWKTRLQNEFEQPYFRLLTEAVKTEYQNGPVYPAPQDIFRAFDLTPFEDVKVVILGQDPYHTPGVANGLSFSTTPGQRVPPSLQNIFKEIGNELYNGVYPEADDPDLTRWAKQGVLLLNSTLTVRARQANSHKDLGWADFTDAVIQTIAREKKQGVAFLLWGKFASLKASLVTEAAPDPEIHLVLRSAHPSPFSAERGFFGNGHFKQVNEYLRARGQTEIRW